MVVLCPAELARFIAIKGSLVVNGVSLTVNRLDDRRDSCGVSINLIPHTLSHTTLGELKAGSRVNREVDLIARYVERLVLAPGIQAR
jgi:riboflavin synthase